MCRQWKQDYERDGFVVAHELFRPAECEELKAAGPKMLRGNPKPNTTVFVGAAAVSKKFYELASDERIVSMLREIMPDGIMFMSDEFVFKSGG